MKNQFVTFEIAKKLKELGFNNSCLASYFENNQKIVYFAFCAYLDDEEPEYDNNNYKYNTAAPLWQQVIDWLKETHKLGLEHTEQSYGVDWFINNGKGDLTLLLSDNEPFNPSREKAIIKALNLIKK